LPKCRKQTHESSSQLQIILGPRAPTTLTSDLIQPSNPAHHAFAESARPSLQPTIQGALNEMLIQKASTEPLAELCIPLQLPSADALSSAAVRTTDEDHDSFQATELSGIQNSEPAGSHDFASQASGSADAKSQQHQHLPEAVSAIVRQHKLQLQIVKVSCHIPLTSHQQAATTIIHCWHFLACTLHDRPDLCSVHIMASSLAITGICLAYASSPMPETPHIRYEDSQCHSRMVRSDCTLHVAGPKACSSIPRTMERLEPGLAHFLAQA